jgi:hypothetical protein
VNEVSLPSFDFEKRIAILISLDTMANKQFILIAGFDYEFSKLSFRTICERRKKQIISANKGNDLTITTYDFGAGEIETTGIIYQGGKSTESTSKVNTHTALTKQMFDKPGSGHKEWHFKKGQSGMMTITDVYNDIVTLGLTQPGSLHELHFFSHGWIGGPILVNSTDRFPYSSLRSADDVDPRVTKDFSAPQFTPVQQQAFKDAFNAGAFSWCWGCAFPDIVNRILYKLEHNRGYKETGLHDDDYLTFTNLLDDELDDIELRVGGKVPDRKKVELQLKALKIYLASHFEGSYYYSLAVGTAKKVYASAPGTYAEFDSDNKRGLLTVSSTFTKHLRFYANYMGLQQAPENRRYIIYDPLYLVPDNN